VINESDDRAPYVFELELGGRIRVDISYENAKIAL
jgi:hypothetical protein